MGATPGFSAGPGPSPSEVALRVAAIHRVYVALARGLRSGLAALGAALGDDSLRPDLARHSNELRELTEACR